MYVGEIPIFENGNMQLKNVLEEETNRNKEGMRNTVNKSEFEGIKK